MRALVVVVPGDPDTRTGGYAYDRRIVAGLRDSGWDVSVRTLDASFPHPTAAARRHAARTFAEIADDALVIVDGLAFGALPDEAAHQQARLRLVALVHHPLALETGLDVDVAAALAISERRALGSARRVVVTSRATARALADYGLRQDRIAVVEPGTDAAPLARGQGEPMRLLSVGAITPRKGHHTLIEALGRLSDRAWHLTCVGALDRDPSSVERLRASIRGSGLTTRVTLTGDIADTDLALEYERADLFVLPTYHEGYGMAVAEALARGLPVISTATGAIPELVGGGAGLLVPPGDTTALTIALARVMDDRECRESLAVAARRVRDRLPTWLDAVGAMEAVLEGLQPGHINFSFSADWLAVREPADVRSRSERLTRTVAKSLVRNRPIEILDLAAGTGSNTRYLSGRLSVPQHWTLVDRDAVLLEAAAERLNVATRVVDLSNIDSVARLIDRCDLVTASAFLDLVSEDWLRATLERCRDVGAFVLFALTYDGRIVCSPAEPEDVRIRDLVNLHQRTDKGFGSALGPEAAPAAVRFLEDSGYLVFREHSDWVLTSDEDELQGQLIDGWMNAAVSVAPGEVDVIRRWRNRRLEHLHAGRSQIIVGHEDLAGIPPLSVHRHSGA